LPKIYFRFLRIKKWYIVTAILVVAVAIAGVRAASNRVSQKNIEALSWSVANKVIVIDAGHGGPDPGAVGKSGSIEKDIVLVLSKRLKEIFSHSGAQVIMTRDNDQHINDDAKTSLDSKKVDELKQRVVIANKKKADIVLSIHVNAFPAGNYRGSQVFYQRGSEKSKELAEDIQGELTRILQNTDRLVEPHDTYIMRESKMPAVTVEVGFISNPDEEKLLMDKNYQGKMAWAIYAGVVKYFADKTVPQEDKKSVR